MKCKQARELMGAYLYGDLAPEEMRGLRLHVNECAGCREDLRTRGMVVSSLDTEVPQLDQRERLRIAWSVRGAVKAQERARRVLGLRLAPTFVVAGALIVFILTGAWVTTRQSEQSLRAKQVEKSSVRDSIVSVEPVEKPQNTTPQPGGQTSGPFVSAPESTDDTPAIVLDRIPLLPAAKVITRPTHRKMQDPQWSHKPTYDTPLRILQDDPLPIAKDPANDAPFSLPPDSGNAAREPSEKTTLPEPSDLNDAQIADPRPEE